MGADLHIHSTYSDGSYSPAELVKMALEKGIDTIAIADHDTVNGIEEAIITGRKNNIKVIPAVELSTFRGEAEIHILGYYIDYRNEKFLAKINEIFSARWERARKMVELLNEIGLDITFEEVRKIAGDDYIGRPHIAKAMLSAGYIDEMGEAFTDRYIGNGGRAYVPKFKISPEEAISIIKKAGGIPVLAHPIFINHGKPLRKEGIRHLLDYGLQGLEVYHSKHSRGDSDYYKRIAAEFNLIITGGSDFHGENSPGVNLGDIILDDRYVKRLNEFYYLQSPEQSL